MRKKGRNAAGGPKRPLNSYMLFFGEERLKILAETKDISTRELSKLAGQRWKNMNPEEKYKYIEKYKGNMAVYKQKVKEFNDNNKSNDAASNIAPKQPLNPYLVFARAERPKILSELGNLSVSEVGRELGKRWSSLGSEEKSVFVEISKENRSKYNQMKAVAAVSKERIEPCSSEINLNTSTILNEDDTTAFPSNVLNQIECQNEAELSSEITLKDLGFARQKGYEWHPALKNSEIARGSRIKVTFFGTGDSCFVNKCDWVQFSEDTKSKVS